MRGSPIRLMILAKGRAARSAAEAGVAIATMPTAPIKNLFIFISNLIRCKSARTRKLTLKGNRISQYGYFYYTPFTSQPENPWG